MNKKTLNEAIKNNLKKLDEVEDHDCHLSPEDGCEGCERIEEIKKQNEEYYKLIKNQ